jgi:hypothetical protein
LEQVQQDLKEHNLEAELVAQVALVVAAVVQQHAMMSAVSAVTDAY